MVITCSYKGCTSKYGEVSDISFFRYPVQNNEQCLEWILRSGNDEFVELPEDKLTFKKLCSLHFEKRFLNITSRGIKLLNGALPEMYESADNIINNRDKPDKENDQRTTNLNETDDQSDERITNHDKPKDTNLCHVSSQIVYKDFHPGQNLMISYQSEEINRLKKELQVMSKKYRNERKNAIRREKTATIKRMKSADCRSQLLNDLSKYVKGLPYVFVKMQLKKGKFSTWQNDERDLALNLYYRSPKFYKALSSMGFILPSVRSIQTWMNLLDMNARLDTDNSRESESIAEIASSMECDDLS